MLQESNELPQKKSPFSNEELNVSSCVDNVSHCPVCNFECSHIVSIDLYSGNDDYNANKITVKKFDEKGIDLTPTSVDVGSRLRNLGVVINYVCESRHTWSDTILHHKGSVYKKTDNTKLITEAEMDAIFENSI